MKTSLRLSINDVTSSINEEGVKDFLDNRSVPWVEGGHKYQSKYDVIYGRPLLLFLKYISGPTIPVQGCQISPKGGTTGGPK